jgi:uncharacterized protein (TIGR02145 family)
MKKFLFSVCAVLAIFGCGGENIEDLPPLNPGRSDYGGNRSGKGNNISSYRTVVIGAQKWMAENLDYVVEGSKCNWDCEDYGSFYNWATAMALPSNCNSNSCSSQINSPHRGICPSGWHIPSNADWDELLRYVDEQNGGNGSSGTAYDSYTAGRYLKATSGWYNNGNGTDKYGFSALPGGHGYSRGIFYYTRDEGYWWSASESSSSYAYGRYMLYNYEYAGWGNYHKSYLFSVRCLQD